MVIIPSQWVILSFRHYRYTPYPLENLLPPSDAHLHLTVREQRHRISQLLMGIRCSRGEDWLVFINIMPMQMQKQ